jgi:polyhydroxybutyrate depolymerase
MPLSIRSLFCFLLLLVVSCNKEENPAPQAFKPAADALTWQKGRNDYNLQLGGHLRNFVVHVPERYDASKVTSLVLMLHGSSGDGDRFYKISGWKEKADAEGFIAVFPTGLEYPILENNGKPGTKWSSDGLEKDVVPGTPIIDDVPFIRELVARCLSTFHIHPKSVYISGFSNGGAFVRSRVLPEMNDVFAAAATGGGFGLPAKKEVKNNVFMPLYCIIGTDDEKIKEAAQTTKSIPFEGAKLMADVKYRTQIDGILQTLNLGDEFTESKVEPKYNIITFDNDLSRQGNEYNIMVVGSLEHEYPNGSNNKHQVNAADVLWPWFQQFQLK